MKKNNKQMKKNNKPLYHWNSSWSSQIVLVEDEA